MTGRKAGFRHNQDTRDKIKAAQIINRLQKHVDADKPIMEASQVNAAKVLLNKVLPDLKAVEFDGNMNLEAGDSLKALMEAVDGRTRSK